MRIYKDLSPNFSKKGHNNKRKIKFVIFHYTGMQSEIESIKRLKNPVSKVSCHYLVNRKGKVSQMVGEDKIAWHAGKSKWKNIINLNNSSIGIELVNRGHRHGYENFPKAQIKSLIALCKLLKKKYKIKAINFLAHSDIAPLRKVDPGEKFPWKKLSHDKIGLWPKKKKIKFKNILTKNEIHKFFFKNIYQIGYRYFKIKRRDKKDKLIVKAFQRRYNPKKIDGKIDLKVLKISHLLAKRSH